MTDPSGGASAPVAVAVPAPARTTLRDLAPWAVLALVSALAIIAKGAGADASVLQLLSTVAGIAGGAVVTGRKSEPTTVTAGDPPTVTTGG